MRRLFLLSLLAAVLASCSDYRKKCSADNVYHQHSFRMVSTDTSSELGYDGWYLDRCSNCGLERKFNTNIEASGFKYGSVNLFKSPSTGTFSDLCVCWVDLDTGETHYDDISESQIKPTAY